MLSFLGGIYTVPFPFLCVINCDVFEFVVAAILYDTTGLLLSVGTAKVVVTCL